MKSDSRLQEERLENMFIELLIWFKYIHLVIENIELAIDTFQRRYIFSLLRKDCKNLVENIFRNALYLRTVTRHRVAG